MGINTDADNIVTITKDESWEESFKIDLINVGVAAEQVDNLVNVVESFTAKVPDHVKAQGEAAEDIYRKAIANGMDKDNLEAFANSSEFAQIASLRARIEQEYENGTATAEYIYTQLHNEVLAFANDYVVQNCSSGTAICDSILRAMGATSEDLSSGAIVDLMLAIEGLYKSGGDGFALEGVVDETGAQIIGDSLMQVAIDCSALWFNDLYNTGNKEEANKEIRRALVDSPELKRMLKETGTDPFEWLASTGFFEQSRTEVPKMDSAEMKKLTQIVNSGRTEHLMFEDAKIYFDNLYKQDPMAASEFFINFVRAYEKVEEVEEFKSAGFNKKNFTELKAAGYVALYEAGNCDKGCDFSAMGMDLTQDDILQGLKNSDLDIQSMEDLANAWGLPLNDPSNIGIDKYETNLFFNSSTMGSANDRGLFDRGRYVYEHEGESYVLIPSPISKGTSNPKTGASGSTIDNPSTLVIKIRPNADSYVEPHEDFHAYQMSHLFDNFKDGIFDTDGCMGDSKCKGNLLTFTNLTSPVGASSYKPDNPKNKKIKQYIYQGYKMSIVEYPAFEFQDLINKSTYDGIIDAVKPNY